MHAAVSTGEREKKKRNKIYPPTNWVETEWRVYSFQKPGTTNGKISTYREEDILYIYN